MRQDTTPTLAINVSMLQVTQAGWVAAMREDNGVIFKAAADAQRAFDFLVGGATFPANESRKTT